MRLKQLMQLKQWLWQSWFALSVSTRVAVVLWSVMILGVLGRVALSPLHSHTVVPIYQAAAERWQHQLPLYSPQPNLDLYRNPPGLAALWSHTPELPPRWAAIVWRILSVSVLLAGLMGLARSMPDPRALGWSLAAILALPSVDNGQVNIVMTGAILCGWSAARRERWWQSGFWLGLAVSLKLYPLALVGLLALCWPRVFLLRAALVIAGWLALPCLLVPEQMDYALQQYRDFVALLQWDDRSYGALGRAPRDWTYLVRLVSGEVVAREVSLLVAAGAGLIMAALVIGQNRPALRVERAVELGLIWMTLFGPATESVSYSLLAPLAILMFGRRRALVETLLTYLGFLLLAAAVLRGALPPPWGFPLTWAQPTGAALLLLSIIGPAMMWPTPISIGPRMAVLIRESRPRARPGAAAR